MKIFEKIERLLRFLQNFKLLFHFTENEVFPKAVETIPNASTMEIAVQLLMKFEFEFCKYSISLTQEAVDLVYSCFRDYFSSKLYCQERHINKSRK